MSNPYDGREQTQAKHFILRHYLEALAMKLLTGGYSSLSYIDGFSGPWESQAEDFADTSFKIALSVLSDVARHFRREGQPKQIRCFFVEKDKTAFEKLQMEASHYHDPENLFTVRTANDKFEDVIPEIQEFTKDSFSLIFIDPTGWTGYPLKKISSLLRQGENELLLNFMYDHINRFASSTGEPTVQSFEPTLGKGWKNKIDKSLPIGPQVEAMLRDKLRDAGPYEFVIPTRIEKTIDKRTHFTIIYATRKYIGLKVFRDISTKALLAHESNVLTARGNEKNSKYGGAKQASLFEPAEIPEAGTFTKDKKSDFKKACYFVEERIKSNKGRLIFQTLSAEAMETFMVRETEVKDICVALAQNGKIEATWKQGSPRRWKPGQNDILIWIGDKDAPTPPSP